MDGSLDPWHRLGIKWMSLFLLFVFVTSYLALTRGPVLYCTLLYFTVLYTHVFSSDRITPHWSVCLLITSDRLRLQEVVNWLCVCNNLCMMWGSCCLYSETHLFPCLRKSYLTCGTCNEQLHHNTSVIQETLWHTHNVKTPGPHKSRNLNLEGWTAAVFAVGDVYCLRARHPQVLEKKPHWPVTYWCRKQWRLYWKLVKKTWKETTYGFIAQGLKGKWFRLAAGVK